MTGRLAGKVAAITGGSSGLGAAAAKLFVAEGAKVVLGDIQDERGAAQADSLGDAARFIHCDVTTEDDVAALVDKAVSDFGRLDVMYNNAGIPGALGPIDTTPYAEWTATLDVLLNGTFLGIKHAARGDETPEIRRDHLDVEHRRDHGRDRAPRVQRGQVRGDRHDEERRH